MAIVSIPVYNDVDRGGMRQIKQVFIAVVLFCFILVVAPKKACVIDDKKSTSLSERFCLLAIREWPES